MLFYFKPTLPAGTDPGDFARDGLVDSLFFYASPARTGEPVFTASPGVPTGTGLRYSFTLPESAPEGRYWVRASWRPGTFDDPVVEDVAETVNYPLVSDQLIIAEDLAVSLGFTLPLTSQQRAQLNESIADAQAAVELAIGSVIPKRLVLRGAAYDYASGKDRMDALTWFTSAKNITILDWSVNQDGVTYDVTYLYGFDGRLEPPIKRFVVKYAAAAWRKAFGNDLTFGQVISSVSTEGQSVSYSTKENIQDVDLSSGMSLQALIDRYGAAKSSEKVRVSQQRNMYYGADRTYWRGDGYVWPDVWLP